MCDKIAVLVVVFILLVVFWPGPYTAAEDGILDRAQNRFRGLVDHVFWHLKNIVPASKPDSAAESDSAAEPGSAAESMTMPHFWAQYHKPAVLGR
jgi:hypothetical protein